MPRPSPLAAVPAVALPSAAVLAALGTALRLSGRSPTMASAPLSVLPLTVPVGAALTALAARRGARLSTAALGASVAAIAVVIAPRVLRSRQPDPGPGAHALKVMSINVFKGAGDPQILLTHLRARHPHVVAIQEQSPGYVRRLVAAGIEELLPYRVAGDGRRVNDPAIFSRYPLEPLPVELPSVFVGAVMRLPDGAGVSVISAHPLPPASVATERHWAATLSALPSPDALGGPAIMAGDFNATLDHPAFRAVLARGWRDAAAEVGAGARATWSGRFGLPRMTIDHVLVSAGAAVRSFRVDRLTGSDHRILTARVELPVGER